MRFLLIQNSTFEDLDLIRHLLWSEDIAYDVISPEENLDYKVTDYDTIFLGCFSCSITELFKTNYMLRLCDYLLTAELYNIPCIGFMGGANLLLYLKGCKIHEVYDLEPRVVQLTLSMDGIKSELCRGLTSSITSIGFKFETVAIPSEANIYGSSLEGDYSIFHYDNIIGFQSHICICSREIEKLATFFNSKKLVGGRSSSSSTIKNYFINEPVTVFNTFVVLRNIIRMVKFSCLAKY